MLQIQTPPLELTPPCTDRCPVRNDWPLLLRLVESGDHARAARHLLHSNPFPATLGRVCPHPCETRCNRKAMGGAVQLHSVERFLGDYALEQDLLPSAPPATRGSVGVVGSGPAGLSAAWFLRRLGYEVTVYEKEDRAGGLLWSGIPSYRLPRKVLAREIERFARMGIHVQTGKALGRHVTMEGLRKRHVAVVLSPGLTVARRLGIPGEEHPDVLQGTGFLRSLHREDAVSSGERIAVVGGGNTALDCARTLIRQGKKVTVLYRRSKREMPAFKAEVAEALEEGVEILFQVQPVEVLIGDGQVDGLLCVRTSLGAKDACGRPRPVPVEGSQFTVRADTVLAALGEERDRRLPDGSFVCGDAAETEGTVAHAVASARETAYQVHAHLSGRSLEHDPLRLRGVSPELALFKRLDTSGFRPVPPPTLPIRPAAERVEDFLEIHDGLGEEDVRGEAGRCFQCGSCARLPE